MMNDNFDPADLFPAPAPTAPGEPASPAPTADAPAPASRFEWCCDYGEACPCDSMKLPGDGPASLKKASWDLYHYAALIEGVGLIEFRRAAYLGGGWWRLIDLEPDSSELLSKARRGGYGFAFDRGIDVHASRIIWCADVG